MSAPTITSYKTIRAGFPLIPFIATENNLPNLKFLLLCAEHLGECAQSHRHRVQTFGHRYLALTLTMWALESADAYPVTKIDPGPTVTNPNGATTLQHATRDAEFPVEYRDYGGEKTMDDALVNRRHELLDRFAMDHKDEARGIGTPTFLQIKATAVDAWGNSTPAKRDENLNAISASWHPPEGVKCLFRRAKDAIAFSTKIGDSIPNNIIVDKVIMVINQSQAHKKAYKNFKALAQVDQDFAHVITHFKAAERLRKECQDTAQDRGYGMNAEEAAMEGATRGLTDLANSIQ